MIGTSLAHYKILDKLGEGGMGVVYRARDPKLERDVAIKVLPPDMGDDPERGARFGREARTLASLQHANIASIYGYEEVEGVRFLVMELIEGEDLEERIQRAGPVPLDEALDMAGQIAAGLEAAHDQNIIHRDLKPANIKVTPQGEVKILDFGLARAYIGDDGNSGNVVLSQSPTITENMTRAGVILGTAAYMSPEQARGKAVDKRSDLWAFGVILFELLTGKRLFAGETVSDTLASVLREPIDFDELPADTPMSVRRLLRRCLERDARRRLRSAGDAALELTDAHAPPPEEAFGAQAAGAGTTQSRRGPVWLWALAAVLTVASITGWFTRGGSDSATEQRSLHLEINVPEGMNVGSTPPALSPDGKWLAFTVVDSLGRDVLYLRPLSRFVSEPAMPMDLDRHVDVGALFWSPDSKNLGIQTGTAVLSMDIATRSVQRITDTMSGSRGAAWAPDGTILLVPGANTGIFALDAFGEEPRQITHIDSTRADASHRWPVFLPDGKHFLFTQWSNAAQEQDEIGGIFVSSVDGMEPVRLLKDPSQVLVDPAGYLLFHRQGNLVQTAFDFDQLNVHGDVKVVTGDLNWDANNGSIKASASQTGDVVLGGTLLERNPELGWLDRDGSFTKVADIQGSVFGLYLSPTGRHAAMDRLVAGSSIEIWIIDLDRGVMSLISHFGSDCWGGAFSPDGRQYVYTSQDPGFERFYAQGIDGANPPVQLLDIKSVGTDPEDWSRNGELLYSKRPRDAMTYEIWAYDFESGEDRQILADDFNQSNPKISPDGRWLAYASMETGRTEVYVRPYPDLNRKWQVSTEGGGDPSWRGDGKQLAYFGGPGRLYAVDLSEEGGELVISSPSPILSFGTEYGYCVPNASLTRFLCTRSEGEVESRPYRYISNWNRSAGG